LAIIETPIIGIDSRTNITALVKERWKFEWSCMSDQLLVLASILSIIGYFNTSWFPHF